MSHDKDIAKMFECLYANEIAHVEATFAGSGDSGQIDVISGTNVDDECVTEKELQTITIPDYIPAKPDEFGSWTGGRWTARNFKIEPLTLYELTLAVAYEELEERHGGWEINAGSSGTIEITVPRKKDGTLGKSSAADITVDIEHGYEDDEEYDDEEEYNDE